MVEMVSVVVMVKYHKGTTECFNQQVNTNYTHSRGELRRRRGGNEVKLIAKDGVETLLGDLDWMLDMRDAPLGGCLHNLWSPCMS